MIKTFGRKRSFDNKGFSLVELLIAISIASIVGASVFGFMTVGAKTFGSTSSDVNLQNEAQLAFNQIQDIVIDTVVGIDYVYVTSDFNDDSNTIINDSSIPDPSAVIGKKLLMYNTPDSDRSVYEIVWKDGEDERKLYYSEYKPLLVTDGNGNKVVKPDRSDPLVKDALLAEYVTDFSADLSLADTKRIARIEITYDKNGRTYTSSHNITLRNKVVSGNEVPEYMVSENIITKLPVDIIRNDIYLEPGDEFVFTADKYYAVDEDNNPTGSGLTWTLEKSDGTKSDNISGGTELTYDGHLKIDKVQKGENFKVYVRTNDGRVKDKEVVVNIIRIETLSGKEARSVDSTVLDTGAIKAKQKFILEVDPSLMGGTNLSAQSDKTGRTGVEDKVVFVKTAGSDLFTIQDQDGYKCTCVMNNTIAKRDDMKIGVVAVSTYSMGGRGLSAPTNKNLSLTDFDYKNSGTKPSSIGAASGHSDNNRYYDGSGVAPVVYTNWSLTAKEDEEDFRIDVSSGEKRGQHYAYDFNKNKKDLDKLNIQYYMCVLDVKVTEYLHKQTENGNNIIAQAPIYPYSDLTVVGGEGSNWGINMPENRNANSDWEFDIKFYIFKFNKKSDQEEEIANKLVPNGATNGNYLKDEIKKRLSRGKTLDGIIDEIINIQGFRSAYNDGNSDNFKDTIKENVKIDIMRYLITRNGANQNTYIRINDKNMDIGQIKQGNIPNAGAKGKGIYIPDEYLEAKDGLATADPINFPRLLLTYFYNNNDEDPYFKMVGQTNTNGVQKVNFYAHPFGKDVSGGEKNSEICFTHSEQFKLGYNNIKYKFYKEKDGTWAPYVTGKDNNNSDNIAAREKWEDYTVGTVKAKGNEMELKQQVKKDVGDQKENNAYLWFAHNPSNYNRNTPKHLKLVPYWINGDRNDSAFDSDIDVWLWNIYIDEDNEVTYFPNPEDSNFENCIGDDLRWNYPLAKNKNKVYYYTLKQHSGGTAPDYYELTLESFVSVGNYSPIATYKYNDKTLEWERTKTF